MTRFDRSLAEFLDEVTLVFQARRPDEPAGEGELEAMHPREEKEANLWER